MHPRRGSCRQRRRPAGRTNKGDRRPPVPVPADRLHPSLPGLPQARHHLPGRPPRRARRPLRTMRRPRGMTWREA